MRADDGLHLLRSNLSDNFVGVVGRIRDESLTPSVSRDYLFGDRAVMLARPEPECNPYSGTTGSGRRALKGGGSNSQASPEYCPSAHNGNPDAPRDWHADRKPGQRSFEVD